eukprot:jgi/Chrzof1/10466/UNPLg00393.t1
MTACQLVSVHLVIKNAVGKVHSTVSGEEAIVWHFATLELGGRYRVARSKRPTAKFMSGAGEFVYQSCTRFQSSHYENDLPGSIEGYFTIVEGSIERPTGPQFQMTCPKFSITVPDIVF